jgi:tetratricopeptide (TPR) repeat protein
VIWTVRSGYRLDIGADQLDLNTFRDLVARAADRDRAGDLVGAIAGLREALDLWRGYAFAGIASATIEASAALLNEERLTAWEECIRLELRAGRPDRVVTELVGLVAEFPFREQLTGQLMLALYRTGRQKDALDVFQRLRVRLDDELGIDPGPALRLLHQRILRNDPTVSGAPEDDPIEVRPAVAERRSVPSQLPPPVGHFTGREYELEILSRDPGCAQVIAVTGAAGMGKTALVVQWAHRVRDKFPDGQIFLDLQGDGAGAGRSPSGVLIHLLESLQLAPPQIPGEFDRLVSLYRSTVSEKRILIVLDNVGGIDQVLPVVPTVPGSQLVVTSRNRLAALHTHVAAKGLSLGTLSYEESLAILARGGGQPPSFLDDPATERLIQLCGGMPLALRILAARLVSEAFLSLDDLIAEISREGALLDGFVIDGDTRNVRSVLATAYAALPGDDARIFRLLATHPGRRLRPELVAAMAGASLPAVRRNIDNLVGLHLVEEVGGGYLAMHDLVRSFAKECLHGTAEDRPAELTGRLLAWYQAVTGEANLSLRPDRDAYRDRPAGLDSHVPPFPHRRDAIEFLNGERDNLAPVVSLAADHDVETAIGLIYHLHSYFVRSGFSRVDVDVWTSCLDRLHQIEDRRVRAHLHHALGAALAMTQELDRALDHLNLSAELYAAEDDPAGAAGARLGIGWVLEASGKFHDALIEYEHALGLGRAAHNVSLTVHALNNSADALVAVGEVDAGLERLEMARVIAQESGLSHREALILSSIGALFILKREYRTALEYLYQALTRLRRSASRLAEAQALTRVGVAVRGCDAGEEADPWFLQALAIYRESNDTAGEAAVLSLMAEPAGG